MLPFGKMEQTLYTVNESLSNFLTNGFNVPKPIRRASDEQQRTSECLILIQIRDW